MKKDIIVEFKNKYSIHRNKNSKQLRYKLINDEKYMRFSKNVNINLFVHFYMNLQVWSDLAGVYYELTDGGALFLDIIKVIIFPITIWF